MTDMDDYGDKPDEDDEEDEEPNFEGEPDYDENDEDGEDDEEYYTKDGMPVIGEDFYSKFLDNFNSDYSEKLTGLVKKIREENPNILRHAVLWAENFPEEYRDQIVYGQLLNYEMLRQRTIELDKMTSETMKEQEEDGTFRFERYDWSKN